MPVFNRLIRAFHTCLSRVIKLLSHWAAWTWWTSCSISLCHTSSNTEIGSFCTILLVYCTFALQLSRWSFSTRFPEATRNASASWKFPSVNRWFKGPAISMSMKRYSLSAMPQEWTTLASDLISWFFLMTAFAAESTWTSIPSPDFAIQMSGCDGRMVSASDS